MTDDHAGRSLLKRAYELTTAKDSERYYDAMASSYDADFARGLGYDYPKAVAAIYHECARDSDRPVADIGCGTGLVAESLDLPADVVDGMDISPAMIDIAMSKGRYRRLFRVDLTTSAEPIRNGYGAVLSAGTFTHGHLGPEPLENLLSIASPGALFVIGVNKAHYRTGQFDRLVSRLRRQQLIADFRTHEAPIYSTSGHAHSDDVAMILVYRKTARSSL